MGELDNQSFDPTIKTTKIKINTPPLSWDNSQEHQKLLTEKKRENQKEKYKENSDTSDNLIKLRSIITIDNLNSTQLIDELEKTKEAYSDMRKPEDEINTIDIISNKADSLFARGEEYFLGNRKICLTSNMKVKSKAQLRIYQDKLIEKILGTNKGFDDKYIKGFIPEIGNYLMEIKDYEEYIGGENSEDINSILLANYLQFLNSKGKLNVWTLREKFGSKLLTGIGELWKNNKGGTIAQKLLKEAGIEKIINKIVGFYDIVKDPKSAIEKLSEEELPKEKEINNTPLKELSDFNEKYNNNTSCPFSNNKDKDKFTIVLEISKRVQLEKQEEEFNKNFEKHIKGRLKDKYDGKIPKELQENMEKSSKINLEILLNLIKEKPCSFTLLSEARKLEEQFFKENSKFLNNEKLTKKELKESALSVTSIAKSENYIEINLIQNKLQELNKKPIKNKEQIKRLKLLLSNKKKQNNKYDRISDITHNITLEQLDKYDSYIANGMNEQEAVNSIIKGDENLSKIFKKYNSSSENKQNEEKKENNKYDIDDDDYIKSDSGYTIKLENGEKIPGLIISPEEKELTSGNPEALKNLINFYKFFKDLNLEGVWKYRKQLALSMGSVNININDNDSVSEAELLKFGKKIIQVINAITPESENKLSENPGNLNAMKAELRTYSGAGGALNEDATFNILGEDKFIAGLRKQGIIGGAYFHTMQLRKLMN